MLTISSSQLWNYWFGLEVGYKWACKNNKILLKNNNKVCEKLKYD